MKTKDFVIVMLFIFLMAVTFYSAFQIKLYVINQKADKLAITLSQVNKMLNTDNQVVLQINDILGETGYSHLKRITKEGKNE
ncbi:MAG: hypothetical protein U9O94_10775 [Nanoarchaeota archaeon]|nr:hypothetical protein [Nanoarchaeota archaeon]